MLGLVICLDARRKRIVVCALAEKSVCQGDSDQAGDGQDEEGEELGLIIKKTDSVSICSG